MGDALSLHHSSIRYREDLVVGTGAASINGDAPPGAGSTSVVSGGTRDSVGAGCGAGNTTAGICASPNLDNDISDSACDCRGGAVSSGACAVFVGISVLCILNTLSRLFALSLQGERLPLAFLLLLPALVFSLDITVLSQLTLFTFSGVLCTAADDAVASF